jgi:TolB-like protein/DNA-binding winged helix-turn-helix (wHTH) protein/Tfp pilus assembly protein PilF
MDDGARTARTYRFGPFALDARTGELSGDGHPIPLRDQPVQLLLALLERPGDLVTRQELATRLWPPGTFVDVDRGLNKAINHLREALGDSPDSPRYVETLPRKGYRFVAPVTVEEGASASGATGTPVVEVPRPESAPPLSATVGGPPMAPPTTRPRRVPRWLPAALSIAALCAVPIALDTGHVRTRLATWWRGAPPISSLAVLPLQSLSQDPEQEYFADGMTDALITDLAKLGRLHVTSRTSVMRYKKTTKSIGEVGRELGVDAVVEGTVVHSGGRVRINAQLIQVATDTHLWAEAYERDMTEVLGLQRAVATDVARRINLLVKAPGQTRLVDPRAYGLYLKGRYLFHQYTDEGWRQGIDAFTQATQADGTFAPAHAGLADTYLVAGAYGAMPAHEALAKGKEAAARALEIDDSLASAHYALATAYAWYDADWTSAEREFARALALDPRDPLGRNWYGGYLSLRGRHDEAIAEHARAIDLDPLLAISGANLTRALYWARRYDDAVAQAKRTLRLDPEFGVAMLWLEAGLRHKGLEKEAVDLRLRTRTPEGAATTKRVFETEGFAGVLRRDAALFEFAGGLVLAARCRAQLGDTERALALLETCAAKKCPMLVTIGVEPDFDGIRQQPRFQALVKGVGL